MSDVMMNDPNRALTPSEYTTQLATKPAICVLSKLLILYKSSSWDIVHVECIHIQSNKKANFSHPISHTSSTPVWCSLMQHCCRCCLFSAHAAVCKAPVPRSFIAHVSLQCHHFCFVISISVSWDESKYINSPDFPLLSHCVYILFVRELRCCKSQHDWINILEEDEQ